MNIGGSKIETCGTPLYARKESVETDKTVCHLFAIQLLSKVSVLASETMYARIINSNTPEFIVSNAFEISNKTSMASLPLSAAVIISSTMCEKTRFAIA